MKVDYCVIPNGTSPNAKTVLGVQVCIPKTLRKYFYYSLLQRRSQDKLKLPTSWQNCGPHGAQLIAAPWANSAFLHFVLVENLRWSRGMSRTMWNHGSDCARPPPSTGTPGSTASRGDRSSCSSSPWSSDSPSYCRKVPQLTAASCMENFMILSPIPGIFCHIHCLIRLGRCSQPNSGVEDSCPGALSQHHRVQQEVLFPP